MATKSKHNPFKPRLDNPYLKVWERVDRRLEKMTDKEVLQTFVSAKILTEKGNVTKPYRGVFVKKTKA